MSAPPTISPAAVRAYFLSPEPPVMGKGGGGMRSLSLLEYLQSRYEVHVDGISLPHHSNALPARVLRNAERFVRGVPPLFDRYSGHAIHPKGKYSVAVLEHFWCASYAEVLRPHADLLVLDLHNVESALARSCARGIATIPFRRFAHAYRRLEKKWLPKFDLILVASEDDRDRILDAASHRPRVIVYPNAIDPNAVHPNAIYFNAADSNAPPAGSTHLFDSTAVAEEHAILFTGNMEYHPNIEAVRWFLRNVWPALHRADPDLSWHLFGSGLHSLCKIPGISVAKIRMQNPDQTSPESFHTTWNTTLAEIASAKVCIVPLLAGSGTRFKILEAWAARRAVVSTTLGAEGLGAEGLGAISGQHLLIADDPASFSEAILRLLRSPELRDSLGCEGNRLLRSHFTWPTAWSALEQAGL